MLAQMRVEFQVARRFRVHSRVAPAVPMPNGPRQRAAFVVFSMASGPGLKRVSGMSALKSTKNRKTTLLGLSGEAVLIGGNRRTTAAYQIPLGARRKSSITYVSGP